MNHYFTKKMNRMIHKLIFFSFFCLLSYICSISLNEPLRSANAAERNLTLQSSRSTITVGKHSVFTVKNLSNDNFVLFFSSNPKTASIERTTGKFFAKKKGKITISAQIYRQNKKIKTLKKEITIHSKEYIENAHFSLKKSINPYDHTIILKSSRIILKKEIKKSKLSITPEGKKTPKLSAAFSRLSKNGKEIIYLLNASSQKKLCPHNNSMNGNYIICSGSFDKKIKASYKERLGTENISGFVLDINGTPLSNAFITFHTTEGISTSYTNESGHYNVKGNGTPVSLSVEKKNYQKEILTSILFSKKGTICENFILKPNKNKKLTLDFSIKDENGIPVSNAQIFFLPKSKTNSNETDPSGHSLKEETFSPDDVLISAQTGKNGTLLITNQDHTDSQNLPYTKITAKDTISLSLLSSHAPSNDKICHLPDSLDLKKEYFLYILKNTKTDAPSFEPYKLTFSPSTFYTDHLYFEITLKTCTFLNASDLKAELESSEYSQKLDSFSISFFEAGQKKAVYECNDLPAYDFFSSKILTPEFPVSFSDGNYYIQISALDKNKDVLYFSPITKIQIKKSQILPTLIKLQKRSYSRLLVYFSGEHFPEHIEKKTTFELYQKMDDTYFYLDTVSSSDFRQTISDLYTADFSLSCLLASQTYLFVPENRSLRPSSFITAQISPEHLYPNEAFALLYPPFAKCSCIYAETPKTEDVPLPDDFYTNFIRLSFQTNLIILKEQIRTEPSYLNSVIVLYKKDGTLISTSLSPKLDKNTVFSKRSNMVIDIYTNHELLLTNQSSYH